MKDYLLERGIDLAINLGIAVVMFVVGLLVINLLSKGLEKALSKSKRHELLTRFVGSVVSKSCWAFLIVAILGRLGFDIGPLIAGLGVTGFILGFAFQESLGNLASGLMIAVNEPFKVGDYVIIGGLEGAILEVNMMATVMTTADNKKIVVPNKVVWGSPITNFSAMKKRRIEVKVGVSYRTDIKKAREVAISAVEKIPGILQEPAVMAQILSLDDSALVLVVRAWVKNSDYWTGYFAAVQAVKEAFDREGIEIPFPQLDVHVHNG